MNWTHSHSWRGWVSSVALLAGWQLVAMLGVVPAAVLPAPTTLVGTFGELTWSGELPWALLVSTGRVGLGAVIGVAVGLGLGLIAGLSRLGADVVDKPMQMVRTIPFTALAPLLLLWLGLDEAPKITLVAVAVAVPMYINTVGGLRGVDPGLIELGRAYRLSTWQLIRRVLLPGAMGQVLTGLRFALSVAWVAVIVAETVNAAAGIGFLLATARTFARTDIVLVCVVVYALLGLVTDGIVRFIEARLLAWRAPTLERRFT